MSEWMNGRKGDGRREKWKIDEWEKRGIGESENI
jgi:hypothetical protein